MSSQNDGIIVILSSPSGAGKTTLVKLLSQRKNFNISVSHTTREPRSNEIEGKDYFFINNKEFENLKEKKELTQMIIKRTLRLKRFFSLSKFKLEKPPPQKKNPKISKTVLF